MTGICLNRRIRENLVENDVTVSSQFSLLNDAQAVDEGNQHANLPPNRFALEFLARAAWKHDGDCASVGLHTMPAL